MSRKKSQKLCFIISALLLIAFVIKTTVDYFQYDAMVNSAPFSVWILTNAVYLIIPAVISLVVGLIIGKKQ